MCEEHHLDPLEGRVDRKSIEHVAGKKQEALDCVENVDNEINEFLDSASLTTPFIESHKHLSRFFQKYADPDFDDIDIEGDS